MLLAVSTAAQAHQASDAYLRLSRADTLLQLRIDIALRDLDAALDIDLDADGQLTWAEVRDAQPAMERYVRERVAFDGCTLEDAVHALERRADVAYAALSFTASCDAAMPSALRYDVLRELDPTHRGIARIETGRGTEELRILAPGSRVSIGVGAPSTASDSLEFVREGVRHILGGFDHLLFLLCLLLPSVLRRTPHGWQPVARVRDALLPACGIVTAFTIAHSITLALAATRWVLLPAALIEPAIAATIVLAAVDNLRPIFRGRRMLVTFVFGLIHGFGFANVLAELHLPTAQFAWALLQFNAGLEFGQLAVVVMAVSLLYAVRDARAYAAWGVRASSLVAMAIGLLWLIERVALQAA